MTKKKLLVKDLEKTIEDLLNRVEELEEMSSRLEADARERAASRPSEQAYELFLTMFIPEFIELLVKKKICPADELLISTAHVESNLRTVTDHGPYSPLAFEFAADMLVDIREMIKKEAGLIVPDGSGLSLAPLP